MLKRILIPLDGSLIAECALAHGEALARAFGAKIWLLRVVQAGAHPDSWAAAVDSRLERAESMCYLEERAADLRRRGLAAHTDTRVGKAAEEIMASARDAEVDLIVISTHGEGGLTPFRLGGVAWKVVDRAGKSVLLIRPSSERPQILPDYRLVMVPVDGSPRGEWALAVAAAIARAESGELLIVHAVPMPEMYRRVPVSVHERRLQRQLAHANRRAAERYLEECREHLEAANLKVRTRVAVSSQMPEALHRLARAESCGLIVTGAHEASSALRQTYGHVASTLISCSDTPVLVLRDARLRTGSRPEAALGARQLTGNGAGR